MKKIRLVLLNLHIKIIRKEVDCMGYIQAFWNSIFGSLPSVISAILLLILAFIAAAVAKSITVKVLQKLKADKYTDKIGITDEATGSSVEFLGKLVFLIVFLLFLPGVLDKLGMQNVSAPISSLVSQFLNYIPNLIAAIVILVVGLFIARLVRQLLVPVLKKLNVDRVQEKAGIAAGDETSISSVLSYIVYVLILIPVAIAALQVLNITAISAPAISMLDKMISYLPNVLYAIAIVIIGAFIARIAGKLLADILSGVGTDALFKKAAPVEKTKLQSFSISKTIGEIVKYILILLFVVEAVNVLNLEVLRFVGEAIIAYLPLAVSAIIILGAALFAAYWVESLILNRFSGSKLLAWAAKAAIIVLAVFMTLNQLGIATSIVNSAFIIILGAIAVAFAIAFGIGGREFAGNVLQQLENKTNGGNDSTAEEDAAEAQPDLEQGE
jgi:hypothetical protein